MGKRTKRKVVAASSARIGPGSRPSSSSPSPSTSSPSESGRLSENGVAIGTGCPHGANLDKLRSQLAKSTVIFCLDCAKLRSGVSAGKERRGKSKVTRKKLSNSSPSLGMLDEKSSVHKLWVCLSCGHIGCGEGNSSSPLTSNGGGELNQQEIKQGMVGRGHAWQHWLQLKHPMVMLCEDEFSCWCFACEVNHDFGFVPESGHLFAAQGQPGVEAEVSTTPSRLLLLQQSAKLIRDKLTEQIADVRDDFAETNELEASGKPRALIKFQSRIQEALEIHKNTRVMKGLVNLGNTCFFNSVMQNLLSVELLRNHFALAPSSEEGSLTSTMRKFFQEASAHSEPEANGWLGNDAGSKKSAKARGGWKSIDGPYNPKALFGAICSRAPRFKGFQQQDSHELLRCLLDGLHTEEESARKASSKSKTAGGEEALRALLKPDTCENGCDTHVAKLDKSTDPNSDTEDSKADAIAEVKTSARTETFVEQVFGGQLSSTVSCCKCGHSSVVYESFLDLSLPIPSKKVPALQNGNKNGPSASISKRMQPLTGSNMNGKSDPDSDDLKRMPTGPGTALVLLPPPPPKDQSDDHLNADTESDGCWLDYIHPSTGSDNTDWLEFLDDSRDVDSQIISGCAPNPGAQLVSGSTLSCESQIGFCNPTSIHQLSGTSATSDGDAACQLDSSPEGSGLPDGLKENGVFGFADDSLVENGSTSNKFPLFNNLLHLEESPDSISKVKILSKTCDEESGPRSDRCQEIDGHVQMRGGNSSQSFGLTQKADPHPDVDHLIDTIDNTRVDSDIITGPSGMVILLGPPVENRLAVTCQTVDLDGDYDGVGSLFEEDNDNEDRVYGPFPLNQDGAAFDGPYNEVGFDDVLDLSKISSEERADWLISNDGRQPEENDEVSVSLEGCLQVFTRTELLSGENAWACENCTNIHHEKLAMLSGKPLIMSPKKHQIKRSVSKGRSDFPDSSGKKCNGVVQAATKSQRGTGKEDGTVPELASNGSNKDATLCDIVSCNGNKVSCVDDLPRKNSQISDFGISRLGNGPSSAQNRLCMSANTIANGTTSPSGSSVHSSDGITDEVHSNGRGCEALQERLDVNGLRVDYNAAALERIGLTDVEQSSELNGDVQPGEDMRLIANDRLENLNPTIEGNGLANQKPQAETSASEVGRRAGIVNRRSSGKNVKLKKSKSRKVSGEPKKVIKQDATKRFLISRAPPVLTIQLKRFAQDMRGRLSKLSGHVTFCEWLDLYPFLDRRHVNYDCKYRLIGTVEHSGTLKSGHYVAFVRGPPAMNANGLDRASTSGGASSWYYVSDSHVHQTNLEAVLQSEAYLVFYERIDMSYDKLRT